MRQRVAISLVLVCAGAFASAANVSVVHVALPEIASDLGLSAAETSGFQIAFLVALMVFLLPAGRLADRAGAGRGYAAGYVMFAGGSLLCACSGAAPELLLSRVLQAAGAASVLATTAPLVTRLARRERRGRALGAVLACTQTGWIAGPLFGGVVLGAFDWRVIYALGAAVALVAAIAGVGAAGSPTGRATRCEAPGNSVRDRVSALVVAAGLVSCAVLGTSYALAFGLRDALGLSSWEAGAAFALQSGTTALGCLVFGNASDARSPVRAATAGAVILAVGLVGLAFGWPHAGIVPTFFCLALTGIGMGAFAAPVTRAVMSESASAVRCRAGARLSLARNGGHAAGVLLALGLGAVAQDVVAGVATLGVGLVAVAGWVLRGHPHTTRSVSLVHRCETLR